VVFVMLRIRIGLTITMILGSIYAAAGLMTSLTDFGIGVAVVGTAWLLQGLITYLNENDAQVMRRYREDVWARRDSNG
jgi:hypothetical protein